MRYSLLFLLAAISFGFPPRGNCAEDGLAEDVRRYVVERVAGNYYREDPRLAVIAAARVAQILDHRQVEAADALLKERNVPPLRQILAAGRLMVFQFGSDFSILPPQGRELLLTLEGLGDQIRATQDEVQAHPLLRDFAPRPQKLDEFERTFWQYHVLHNRLLLVRQIGEFGAMLVRAGADSGSQARAVAAFAALMEKTSELEQKLHERRLAARIQRVRLSLELLKTSEALDERFQAAYSVDFDGDILLSQFVEPRGRGMRFQEPSLQPHELPEKVVREIEQGRKLAGDLLEKSRLLFEGVHWWFRGRYGRGTNDGGLMKSIEAMESPDARMALFMPMKMPRPTDPLEESAVPAVDRRHYSLWLTTERPRIQVAVLANPDFL